MKLEQRIADVEKEIRETPYHKGTEHHIGKLRARVAKLQDELLGKQTKKGGGGIGYAIRKSGDATVVLVGPPSAGKSTLLNALTNASSRVAPYEFTTVTVIPGMMNYQGAKIQILDVPGLVEGASGGRGRGREVLSVVRGADLLLLITEIGKEESFKIMQDELVAAGARLNQKLPQIKIIKKSSGGIILHKGVKQTIADNTIKEIAQEFGLKNAEITLKEMLTLERLVDAFSQNKVYIDAIYVVNKSDLHPGGGGKATPRERKFETLQMSALTRLGLEELKQAIWQSLGLVRVYSFRPGETIDYNHPLIMKEDNTLADVAQKLSLELAGIVKEAKISGSGSRFPQQKVSLTTRVVDGMEVSFG